MGSTIDRVKGAANSAVGKTKETIGKETGDLRWLPHGRCARHQGQSADHNRQGKAAIGE